MSKYDALRRFLRRRRGEAVQLDFDEIELIIRALLPKAAFTPDWWANRSTGGRRAIQCRAWLDAGYRAEPLLARRAVLFTPVPAPCASAMSSAAPSMEGAEV